eukprot:Gb_26341 [translate_table: standard]
MKYQEQCSQWRTNVHTLCGLEVGQAGFGDEPGATSMYRKCTTGDCGKVLKCNNAGGVPPVTLAEFTLGEAKDFYDVSLVDGYNVPLKISAVGGSGDCRTAGCTSDLNTKCPSELSVSSNGQIIALFSDI